MLPERDLDELLRSAKSTRSPEAALREGNAMGECRVVHQQSSPSNEEGMSMGERKETVDVGDGRRIG